MFQCQRCLKEFPINSRLLRHINGKKLCKLHPHGQDLSKIELKALALENTQQTPIHKCSKCGKIFSSKTHLDRHFSNCLGVGCFVKRQLRLGTEWRGYKKLKNILRAIFYCTYIDNPKKNINLIKTMDGKYYKLYIENKWTGRLTIYTILNKYLFRIANLKKVLSPSAKNLCRFYHGLYISTEKELEVMEKTNNCRAYGGRFFFRLLLNDIKLAIDGGKEAVHQNNIFGMIPYKVYIDTQELENKKDNLELKKLLQEEEKIELKKLEDQLNNEIAEEKKHIEFVWFKNGLNHQVYKEIDNIISSTDMEDNDDILDMENSIQIIMERYLVSNKVQADICQYLNTKHSGISFYHMFKKLESI
jgi:uncharacterized C2H2 Zn-finger protein